MGDSEMANNLEMKMTELLCSKLCHDLISPIGAINNGLEFLQEDTSGMLNEAAQLIGSSAEQAADRLAYFRLAFGAGGSADQVELGTIKGLIGKYALSKKLEVEWAGLDLADTSNIDKSSGKLLLNLNLIAADCLPRGGRVEHELAHNADNPDITIRLSGEKAALREDIKLGLDSRIPAESLTIRNVIAFYCMILAINCQKTLKLLEESPLLIVFEAS